MLPDEPNTTEEIAAVGQSAQWLRTAHPKLLAYVNVGHDGGLSDDFLQQVIGTIRPDALMFDWYPFQIEGTTDTNRWFEDVTAVRTNALQAGIPYWGWLQALSPTYVTSLRIPSESDTRFNGFTLLTAGYTGLGYFSYDDSGGVMFDAKGNPTPFYDQAKVANLEYARLGQSLRYLTSTDVRFIDSGAGPKPPDLVNWAPGAGGDSHIQDILVHTRESPLDQDGLVGFFTADNGEEYFMLTNLFHGATLSATDAHLNFTITFDSSVNSVWRLNRLTGLTEEMPLDADHKLTVGLPGGTGDLFKYDNGNFVGVPEPAAKRDGG